MAAGAALVPLALWTAAAAATPALSTDTELATAGYYRLLWTADTTDVEITEHTAGSPQERIIYSGPDRATLISGQPDGTRIYRAGELGPDGTVVAWSEPVTVTVAHHPLSRALAFFALGACVFLATLALVVAGARRRA